VFIIRVVWALNMWRFLCFRQRSGWNHVFGLFMSMCVCVSLHPKRVLSTIFWKVLDIFYQTFSISAFWDKDERFKFWGQKVKVQGHGGLRHVCSNMLENALLAKCNILKITGLNFTKLSALLYFGTRMNASILGSKVINAESHSVTKKCPAGGAVQSSMLWIEF